MRNLFALIGFATIAFVGLGWYLGWYNLTRQPGGAGTQRFSLEVVPSKVAGDLRKGAERAGEIYEKLTEEAPGQEAKNQQPASQAADAKDAAPVTQMFTPSNPSTATGPRWNSAEFMPPPPLGGQQVIATPQRR